MAIPRGREVWVWFDLISIPQHSRDLQIKAINSLPAYTQLCSRSLSEHNHNIVPGLGRLLELSRRQCGVCPLWRDALMSHTLLTVGSSRSCEMHPRGTKSINAMSSRLTARCPRGRCRRTPSADGVSADPSCLTHHRFTRHLSLTLGRLEILAALTPKKFWRGDWRPGPRNLRFRYHVRETMELCMVPFCACLMRIDQPCIIPTAFATDGSARTGRGPITDSVRNGQSDDRR